MTRGRALDLVEVPTALVHCIDKLTQCRPLLPARPPLTSLPGAYVNFLYHFVTIVIEVLISAAVLVESEGSGACGVEGLASLQPLLLATEGFVRLGRCLFLLGCLFVHGTGAEWCFLLLRP